MNIITKIYKKAKRICLQIKMFMIRDGWKKAEYLKKNKIFHYIGENCYYASVYLPAEPEMISLHDNVVISAGVRFVTHSVAHVVFNNEEKTNKYVCRFGKIEVLNNVYIGADAIIQFDVTINSNVIVGAGAVVTKNIPTNSVVVGIPAKVISTYDESKKKASMYSKMFEHEDVTGDTWVSELVQYRPIDFEK